ncbi:ABC transporter transmembrane domain-containing protein [Streptomyces prasinus]|uniref:ABC transporter transmembrane domain-containing protein n=1 Tax=Streptomyces prasinus TaxID=67345 RepID=UPI0033C1B197
MAHVLRRLLSVGEASDVVAAAPPVSPREVLRRFWPYTRGGRRWFAPVVLFSLLGPALDATEIWLFKIVVDDVFVPRDVGPLLWIAPTYLGLIIGSGILGFADDVTSTWVSERFLLTLRSDVFRHVRGLSLGFFEHRRLGDVLSRVTGDVATVETFLLSGVADALYYVIRLGVFLGLLFYLQWDLTLLALVIVPLFWGAARHFSRLIKEASRERRRRSGSVSAIAEESLGNVALVQAYNRQKWEERRFERENVGRFRATMASAWIRAVYGSVVEVIEVSGVFAVMSLGTWKLAQGQLTLGGLLVFLALIGNLYSPVRGLSHLGTTFYAASASAERIIELLDQRPQAVEAPGARRIGRARGDVEFDGVSFRYPGTPSWALPDVSFHVAAGETLALLGVQLCSALHYLHGQGLLRLDLKPSNVVVDRGHAKVLDLSIARPPGPAPAGVGTFRYLAPEQARGGPLSAAADVWGIGITLYEAAVGDVPFGRGDSREVPPRGEEGDEPCDGSVTGGRDDRYPRRFAT